MRFLLTVIILLAIVMVQSGCGVIVRQGIRGSRAFLNSTLFHQGRHGTLTEEEKKWLSIAWRYFENNVSEHTGLVGSIDKSDQTTMWSTADYLAALVSAHEFELIDYIEFDNRLSLLLHTLNTMELAGGYLPNTYYRIDDGEMINAAGEGGAAGWSAVDIGRLLVWLAIVRERHPLFSEYLSKVVVRWKVEEALDAEGTLYGARISENGVEKYQEGRLGYEEYAALGFRIWGFDTSKAAEIEPSSPIKIYDISIFRDDRDPREHGVNDAVVSLPYLLYGMELNWDDMERRPTLDAVHSDPHMATLAAAVYRVQQTRYDRDYTFTARTDHPGEESSNAVDDAIFAAGYPWNTVNSDGRPEKYTALVSTRAAFGLWGLWKTSYTTRLINIVKALHDTERGWYEGRFEHSGGYQRIVSGTTNAVVMETLLYKKVGKIFRGRIRHGYYENVKGDIFRASEEESAISEEVEKE